VFAGENWVGRPRRRTRGCCDDRVLTWSPGQLRLEQSLDKLRHWRTINCVHFIETQVFTKQITSMLDEAEYRQLQVTLALKPRAGDIIRGSGGLRKIRWAVRGRGKSGGIRVIYYLVAGEEIYFLFAYAKNQQEDLDSGQLRILRNLVREEFK